LEEEEEEEKEIFGYKDHIAYRLPSAFSLLPNDEIISDKKTKQKTDSILGLDINISSCKSVVFKLRLNDLLRDS